MKRALLLLLLLLAPGQAEEVRLRTQPSGASVYDTYNNFLGTSDRSLSVDLARYGERVTLRFESPGYRSTEREVRVEALRAGTYPPDASEGPITLPVQSYFAILAARLAEHPLGAVGLLVIGVFSVWGLLRRRRRELTALRRARELDSRAAQSDPLAGTRLGPWRLLDLLGKGATADVYRAVPDDSRESARAVAVKVFRELDQDTLLRFRREIEVSKNLVHPNLVALLDFGEDQGLRYLVMELVQGVSLRSHLGSSGLATSEAREILRQLCAGVAFAHERGITHRDLKPDNVLLTREGRVKIADFGLAKANDVQTVTQTGFAMGTPAYMAPETVEGASRSPAIDQYALGVMAFEILTGRRPFEDETAAGLLLKHRHSAVPSSGLDAALDRVLAKMLAKSPEQRFPDVLSAARALDEILGGVSGSGSVGVSGSDPTEPVVRR